MHDSFLSAAIWIFSLLGVATLVQVLAKKIKFPFAVALLATGIVIPYFLQLLPIQFDASVISFSPEIVFYVFLPSLIFESAYHLNYRHFRGLLLEVGSLATFGLFLSIAIIGFALHVFFDFPLGATLLFGALISATDPVAVLAIFKEMRAPKKLSTMVDGESLLNDGTALVIFQFLLLNWVSFSVGTFQLTEIISLLLSIIIGIVCGWVMGKFFTFAIAKSENKGVQMTLSFILAHVTFLMAEGVFHASGILATMTAGIIMGTFGKRKFSIERQKSFIDIWSFLEFISNSLIFLLLGMKLGQVSLFEHWELVIASIIICLFIARPVSVFATFLVTNFFRKKTDKSPFSYQFITVWGGIRGALAAVSLLLIPADFPYLNEFYAMSTGVILVTFFVNATTVSYWLKKFKLVQLSDTENIQRIEAKLMTNEQIGDFLQTLSEKKYVDQQTFDPIQKSYTDKKDSLELELNSALNNLLGNNKREIEKVLTHFALGIEIKSYTRLYRLREISEARYNVLTESILRQIDRLEKDVLPEEMNFNTHYAPNIPQFKNKSVLEPFQRIIRTKKILERYQHYRSRRIASWQVILDFESLQNQHKVFADGEIIEKILRRYKHWHALAQKKLTHLQNQHQATIEKFLLKTAQNICTKKEEIIEQDLKEKGLISDKVFALLKKERQEMLCSKKCPCWKERLICFIYKK